MNKRQKKKFIKKNMTKLRKIHPSEGDIIVLRWNPDSEYIDFATIFIHLTGITFTSFT